MARRKRKARRKSPFQQRLLALGYSSYQAYLRSDHWKSVRTRYRASKQPQECRVCGAEKYELHHQSYDRLGREWLKDLVPLCRRHHKAVHRYLKKHPEVKLGETAIILEGIKKRS